MLVYGAERSRSRWKGRFSSATNITEKSKKTASELATTERISSASTSLTDQNPDLIKFINTTTPTTNSREHREDVIKPGNDFTKSSVFPEENNRAGIDEEQYTAKNRQGNVRDSSNNSVPTLSNKNTSLGGNVRNISPLINEEMTMVQHEVFRNASQLQHENTSLSEGHLKWLISEWSPCSRRCRNGTGLQVRGIQCIIEDHNVTRAVPPRRCQFAGLRRPVSLRNCSVSLCPVWQPRKWQRCSKARCISWNTAVQKRRSLCRLGFDGERVPRRMCRHLPEPASERQCHRPTCRGAWHVGPWTSCSARACSTAGLRTRVLRCVWQGSGGVESAGNVCSDLPRPAVLRPCLAPACPPDGSFCEDRATYCDTAVQLAMCRLKKLQNECCASCRRQIEPS